MTVSKGHFSLTPEQRKFKKMIDPYPHLARLWDFDKRECGPATVTLALDVLPGADGMLLSFFYSVWSPHQHPFDFVEAAKVLDAEQRQVIATWLVDPFFP